MLWKVHSLVALSSHVLTMFILRPAEELLALCLLFIIEFLTQPLQIALMSIYLDWHMTRSEWCVALRFTPRIGWHSLAAFLDMTTPQNTMLHMSAGRYRQVRGPARAGRPRLHWTESTMTEASHRIKHLQSDAAPSHSDPLYSKFCYWYGKP